MNYTYYITFIKYTQYTIEKTIKIIRELNVIYFKIEEGENKIKWMNRVSIYIYSILIHIVHE